MLIFTIVLRQILKVVYFITVIAISVSWDFQINPFAKATETIQIDLLSKTILSVEPPTQVVSQAVNLPTIEQIKRIAFEQKATLIYYSINQDLNQEVELLIWAIQPTGQVELRRQELKSLKISLADLVTQVRESIRGSSTNNLRNQGRELQQLYQILIEPIAEFLPKQPESRVIFIPQSSLFLVPFAALIDRQGKYLIETHTILTAPSIQVLDLTHQRRRQIQGLTQDVLIVGNPTRQQPELLPSLPGAQQEAIAIAQIFNTQPLLGSNATKAAVLQKMPNSRIIHLATHTFINEIQGLESGLALTSSENDNGILTAAEILDLRLNAELVVLSGDNTGLGQIAGDGVIGLSRSFMAAGVPSVIVSLWTVPDVPTAELMIEFYRFWQQKPDKAQALRQSMIKTMKKYPHPRDWAGFTLIGEAE